MTDEKTPSRNKKGQFVKGHTLRPKGTFTPWNKGVTGYTTSQKGQKKSEEHKKKISEAMKGNKNPAKRPEVRKKISEAMKGKTPWMKNKRHTKESKRKMSEAKWNMSEKTKRKLSEYQKKNRRSKSYYRKIGLLGIKKMAEMREPTSIEKKLYEELKAKGVLFEKQKLINGKFVVDAYIPILHLVIEADGDYWHSLPKQIIRDKSKDAYLTKCGFNLLRITGTEINSGSFKLRLDKEMN